MNIRTGWFRLPEQAFVIYQQMNFDRNKKISRLFLSICGQVYLNGTYCVDLDLETTRKVTGLTGKNWRQKINIILRDLEIIEFKKKPLVKITPLFREAHKRPSVYRFQLADWIFQPWETSPGKYDFSSPGWKKHCKSFKQAKQKAPRLLRLSAASAVLDLTPLKAKVLCWLEDQVTMPKTRGPVEARLFNSSFCPLLTSPMMGALGKPNQKGQLPGWGLLSARKDRKGLLDTFGLPRSKRNVRKALKILREVTEDLCGGILAGRLPSGEWVRGGDRLSLETIARVRWYPFIPASWLTAPLGDVSSSPGEDLEPPHMQVKSARLSQNLTQEEFGKLFNVSERTVRSWERGRSKIPARVMAWLLTGRKSPSGRSKPEAKVPRGDPNRKQKSLVAKIAVAATPDKVGLSLVS